MCQSKSGVPQLLFVRDLLRAGLADWRCFSLPPMSPCFLLMYNYALHRSGFCHLLWFRPPQYQREAALLSRHQPRMCPRIFSTAFFRSLSFPLPRRGGEKYVVWGWLWVSRVRSCAYNVCIFHLRIAEKNWECEMKQITI